MYFTGIFTDKFSQIISKNVFSSMAVDMLRNSPFWPSLNEFLDRYELHNDQKPTKERIKNRLYF